jgi:exosortase
MSQPASASEAPRGLPFLPLILLAAALAGLFAPAVLALAQRWEADPNYSHGYLVPLISLALAWHAYQKAGAPERGAPAVGVAWIFVGVSIHLAAILGSWPLLDFPAIVLVLHGVAVAAGGREWARHFGFALLFLVFMFPWPTAWMARAALFLQEWVSIIAASVFDLFVVCYRRGTTLKIAGVEEPLVVAEECSGLRQIVAFLALGALLGKLSGRGVGYRLVLLALAVPVAVLANVVRVLLMGLGAVFFGTGWIKGWLHHAPAAFSLPMGIVLYLAISFLLERIWPHGQASTKEEPCPSPAA